MSIPPYVFVHPRRFLFIANAAAGHPHRRMFFRLSVGLSVGLRLFCVFCPAAAAIHCHPSVHPARSFLSRFAGGALRQSPNSPAVRRRALFMQDHACLFFLSFCVSPFRSACLSCLPCLCVMAADRKHRQRTVRRREIVGASLRPTDRPTDSPVGRSVGRSVSQSVSPSGGNGWLCRDVSMCVSM